jgi:hypothetical protein
MTEIVAAVGAFGTGSNYRRTDSPSPTCLGKGLRGGDIATQTPNAPAAVVKFVA